MAMACCGTCADTARVDARLQAPARLAGAWPRTTQVLADFARSHIAAGRPFHVTHYFNSTVLAPSKGLGFFVIDDIIAAAATVASVVGSVVGPAMQVAAVVNTIKGQANASPSGSGVTADDIAAAVLPQVQAQLQAKGVNLPAGVAKQAVTASILDSFGPKYHNLVLFGGLGLAALVVFKMVKG